jgi:hypothetical protein
MTDRYERLIGTLEQTLRKIVDTPGGGLRDWQSAASVAWTGRKVRTVGWSKRSGAEATTLRP